MRGTDSQPHSRGNWAHATVSTALKQLAGCHATQFCLCLFRLSSVTSQYNLMHAPLVGCKLNGWPARVARYQGYCCGVEASTMTVAVFDRCLSGVMDTRASAPSRPINTHYGHYGVGAITAGLPVSGPVRRKMRGIRARVIMPITMNILPPLMTLR